MRTDNHGKGKLEKGKWGGPAVVGSIFYFLFSLFCPAPAAKAQAPVGQPLVGDEVVANLAAGHVVIYVAKDAIVIGLYENKIEPETRAPVLVPLTEHRVGILLGAVDWLLPDSRTTFLRLDQQLPRLTGEVIGTKRLQQEQDSDLEAIGIAMLEPLRVAVERLHHKLALGPDEPFVELLLVDYVEGYGPEVWSLKFRLVQEVLRTDYWRTRVLRPEYTQLYPPEKGQPRTLVEFRYPPEDASPTVLELLARDPRLKKLRSADVPTTRAVQQLEKGESNKALGEDAILFMRAAVAAVAGPGVAQGVGIIRERGGFDWLLAPPQPQRTEEEEKREPGAPTLRKKPPS